MTWVEPIVNRVQSDVEFAIWQLNKWQKQILEGTAITYTDLKGVFNVSDINRIEQNTKYLQNNLRRQGISVDLTYKTWSKSDMPTKAEFARVIGNVATIIKLYYKLPNSINLPNNIAIYTDVNSIEINLQNIKLLLDAMIASYKKSGTTQCGASSRLPKRR